MTGDITNPWKEMTLQTILSNYAKTDIYNADEFGLFRKALPKKTLYLKHDKCTDSKHSKIKVKGLAAENMNGDKLPVFVIGKLKKLRCLKNVKKNYLVVIETRTKAGCMKSKIGKLHSSLITAQPIQILED